MASRDDNLCFEQSREYELKIPYYYLIGFITLILLASVKYFIDLNNAKKIYVSNFWKGIKCYLKLSWTMKSMYGSILTQLFDQVSDISVIIQLALLSLQEKRYNNTNDQDLCPHMNVKFLFWTSLSIFLVYRFWSSVLVYRFSRNSISLSILQFFDLCTLKTLQINYQFQNVLPCSPQVYLTNIEAMFESFPQFLVQSYFLVTLNAISSNFSVNLLFSLSISVSLISIISKKWAQDRLVCQPEWQYLEWSWTPNNHRPRKSTNSTNNSDTTQDPVDVDFIDSLEHELQLTTRKRCPFFNEWFVLRLIWRFMDVTSRLCLWFLIWRIMGGAWVIIIIFFELFYYSLLTLLTNNLIALEGFMGAIIEYTIINPSTETLQQCLETIDNNEYVDKVIIGHNLTTAAIFEIVIIVFLTISDGESELLMQCIIMTSIISVIVPLVTFIFLNIIVGIDRIQILLIYDMCLFLTRAYGMFMITLIFGYMYLGVIILIDIIFVIGLTFKIHDDNFFSVAIIILFVSTMPLKFTFNYKVFNDLFSYTFGFQSFMSLLYYLILLYFTLTNTNITLVNNDTTREIFKNDSIIAFLLVYVGICVVLLPPLTYWLVHVKRMINESGTSNLTLKKITKSGNIIALFEMLEFGIGVDKHDASNMLQNIINQKSFIDKFFPTQAFLTQCQIMDHLSANYSLKISPESQKSFVNNFNLKHANFKFADETSFETFFNQNLDMSDLINLYDAIKSHTIFKNALIDVVMKYNIDMTLMQDEDRFESNTYLVSQIIYFLMILIEHEHETGNQHQDNKKTQLENGLYKLLNQIKSAQSPPNRRYAHCLWICEYLKQNNKKMIDISFLDPNTIMLLCEIASTSERFLTPFYCYKEDLRIKYVMPHQIASIQQSFGMWVSQVKQL